MSKAKSERNIKLDGPDRWRVDFTKNGKRVVRTGFRTKEDARNALDELRAEVQAKAADPVVEPEDPYFDAFADTFIKNWSKARKKRSVDRDELSLKHLKEFFGRRRLSQVTLEAVDKYRNARSALVSSRTVDLELACLKTLLRLAGRYNKAVTVQVRDITLTKAPNTRERVLTADEEQRLLAVCSPRMREFVLIALNTGMRKGEILKLERRHVNFTTRMITVPAENSKSKKDRRVPMNDTVMDLLRPYASNAGYVFGNDDGQPIKQINEQFNGACRRAKKDPRDEKDPGIEGLVFHNLRHTMASRFVARGGNIAILSRILGHSSIQLTYQRYVHTADDDLLREVQALTEKPAQPVSQPVRMPAVESVTHSKRSH